MGPRPGGGSKHCSQCMGIGSPIWLHNCSLKPDRRRDGKRFAAIGIRPCLLTWRENE